MGRRRLDRHYDSGCQLERTALASNRLLLALCANGALLVRSAELAGTWALVVGVAVVLAGVALWASTSVAYRRARGTPARALLGRRWSAALVTGLVALVGVADLVAVVSYR